MASLIRLLLLLLVLWIAYRVTFVCCKGGTRHYDSADCVWTDDSRTPGEKNLVCKEPDGGTSVHDTTGVGSGVH